VVLAASEEVSGHRWQVMAGVLSVPSQIHVHQSMLLAWCIRHRSMHTEQPANINWFTICSKNSCKFITTT